MFAPLGLSVVASVGWFEVHESVHGFWVERFGGVDSDESSDPDRAKCSNAAELIQRLGAIAICIAMAWSSESQNQPRRRDECDSAPTST